MSDAQVDANTTAGTSSSPAPTTDANQAAGSSTTAQNNVAKEAVPTLQEVIGKAVSDTGASTIPSTVAPGTAAPSLPGMVQGQDEAAKLAEQQKEVLPFHDHPRWKEVIAERDNYKTEVDSYKVRTETAEAVVNDLTGYLRDTGMQREEFDQTLSAARLFKTGDMAGFLAQVMPLVQQAQMFTGGYLPPEIQAKVDNGLIDVESAKQLVSNDAKAKLAQQQLADHNSRLRQQQEDQQRQIESQQQREQQQVLERTTAEFATAHEKWTSDNRAIDPGFQNLERAILAEALLIRNANPNAITSPSVWVSVLEQAKTAVMSQYVGQNPQQRRPITPIRPAGNNAPNGAVASATPAKSLRERLDQVVGGSVG